MGIRERTENRISPLQFKSNEVHLHVVHWPGPYRWYRPWSGALLWKEKEQTTRSEMRRVQEARSWDNQQQNRDISTCVLGARSLHCNVYKQQSNCYPKPFTVRYIGSHTLLNGQFHSSSKSNNKNPGDARFKCPLTGGFIALVLLIGILFPHLQPPYK